MNKKKAVREFLEYELEFVSAQMVEASKGDKVNMVDQHFLTGLLMGIQYLMQKNNGQTKEK